MSQAAAHGGDGNLKKYVAVDSDSEDSSIGIPSDDDDDVEDHGEVQSRISGVGALNSLASLETSLPIKKGLSLHYDGRSKSYSNLAEARLEEATQLAKTEHAFNKKRRLINISQKFREYSKKPSNNIVHQSSLPAFPSEDREEVDDVDADAENGAMEDEGSKAECSDLESLQKI